MRWLTSVGDWVLAPEVSFAYGRERGVIDALAWHAGSRSVLVIELKTRLADVNELMATMDVRRRHAVRIARDRGWDPDTVGVWVVLAPGRTNARVLADHSTVLRTKFPHDGRVRRGWLRKPSGSVAALSFMPQVHLGDLGRDATTPRRVRVRGRAWIKARSRRHCLDVPGSGSRFGTKVRTTDFWHVTGRGAGGVRAAAARERSAEDVVGHDQAVDLVRALVDLSALRVAHQPLDPGLA